jgi:hypothetical protein
MCDLDEPLPRYHWFLSEPELANVDRRSKKFMAMYFSYTNSFTMHHNALIDSEEKAGG